MTHPYWTPDPHEDVSRSRHAYSGRVEPPPRLVLRPWQAALLTFGVMALWLLALYGGFRVGSA